MTTLLRRYRDWRAVESEMCRVNEFTPFAKIERGRLSSTKGFPYAAVQLESIKLPYDSTGYIVHKVDFLHLWMAFKVRGVGQDEEVLIAWSERQLKGFIRLFSAFMPKLCVMICKSGAYELINDPNCEPQLQGLARWNAEKPIVEWRPKVWK